MFSNLPAPIIIALFMQESISFFLGSVVTEDRVARAHDGPPTSPVEHRSAADYPNRVRRLRIHLCSVMSRPRIAMPPLERHAELLGASSA